jgi:hypothetical protein
MADECEWSVQNEEMISLLARAGCKKYRYILKNKGVRNINVLFRLTRKQLLNYGLADFDADELLKVIETTKQLNNKKTDEPANIHTS